VHCVSAGESMALPHTYSCTCFYFTKETKGGKQNSIGLNTGEFNLLLNQGARWECGASNSFSFFVIIILFIFEFFYHGKLGMQSRGLKNCLSCFFIFSKNFRENFLLFTNFIFAEKFKQGWYITRGILSKYSQYTLKSDLCLLCMLCKFCWSVPWAFVYL
jgi:hypothetical protein